MFVTDFLVYVLSEDTPLWRIYDTDFKGKVEVLACADDEDGFNFTIREVA
ncbi:hypothetical protein Hanom_Chr16g01431261 [Helianthus anomalus]